MDFIRATLAFIVSNLALLISILSLIISFFTLWNNRTILFIRTDNTYFKVHSYYEEHNLVGTDNKISPTDRNHSFGTVLCIVNASNRDLSYLSLSIKSESNYNIRLIHDFNFKNANPIYYITQKSYKKDNPLSSVNYITHNVSNDSGILKANTLTKMVVFFSSEHDIRNESEVLLNFQITTERPFSFLYKHKLKSHTFSLRSENNIQ